MLVEDFQDSPAGELVPITWSDVGTGQVKHHYAYVPKPLPSVIDLSQATYALIGEADRALGALNAHMSQLPNPELFIRPSLMREAHSTSALEGTYAPFSEAFESLSSADRGSTAAVREIVNYFSAAQRGLELIRQMPLCRRVVSELQEILVDGTRGDSHDAGQLRQKLVCIGGRGGGIEQSRFVPPPPGDLLVAGVSDWEKWINNSTEVPLLVRVAAGHYQFETLHPFSDGNGRIGRLAITLQLIADGALHQPILNLSPWLEPRREDYIDHLLGVSVTGDFEPWIRFFAQAVKDRSEAAIGAMCELVAFRNEITDRLKSEKVGGAAKDLARDLIGYPILSVREAQKICGVSYPAANKAVARLVEMGYLRETTGANYGRFFQCDRVYEIISSY